MKQNQLFSLRRLFKDTSSKQGFQSGPVIVNGQVTYADGGGVCVAATLIFDAALKANLAILEKHNHSTDMWGENRFIHLGGDATYAYGRKDLKLRNTHNGDILVKTSFDYDSLKLTCRFYSPVPLEGTVRIENELLQEIAAAESNEYRKGSIIMTRRYLTKAAGGDTVTYRKKEVYHPFRLKE